MDIRRRRTGNSVRIPQNVSRLALGSRPKIGVFFFFFFGRIIYRVTALELRARGDSGATIPIGPFRMSPRRPRTVTFDIPASIERAHWLVTVLDGIHKLDHVGYCNVTAGVQLTARSIAPHYYEDTPRLDDDRPSSYPPQQSPQTGIRFSNETRLAKPTLWFIAPSRRPGRSHPGFGRRSKPRTGTCQKRLPYHGLSNPKNTLHGDQNPPATNLD